MLNIGWLYKPMLPLLLMVSTSASAQANVPTAPLLQQHPLVGKIYDFQKRRYLTEAQLVNQLHHVKWLLIGEKHDNTDHHDIEAELIQALSFNEAKATVIFEMLNQQHKTPLAMLSANDSLPRLHKLLNWNQQRWSWQSYGPLFQLALQLNMPLVAGNISKQQIMSIYQHGDRMLHQPHFNTMKKIKPAIQQKIIEQLYLSHCQQVAKENLIPMLNIQLARDAHMAFSLLNQTDRAILIAGNFHTDKRYGIPQHLRQYQQAKQYQVLQLTEVEEGRYKANDYADNQQTDYLWFTAKQTNKDYCSALKPANHSTIKSLPAKKHR